jgi:hypothetical protein
MKYSNQISWLGSSRPKSNEILMGDYNSSEPVELQHSAHVFYHIRSHLSYEDLAFNSITF